MNEIANISHHTLKQNLEAARSSETRRAYAQAWKSFSGMFGDSLPASSGDVAVYLSELGKTCTPSTVRLHMSAIAAHHLDSGYPSPTENIGVKRAMEGAARIAQHVPQQSKGLDIHAFDQIIAVAQTPRMTRGGRLETVAEAEMRGIYDVGMVGLMRDCLLRRSECSALVWSDLTQEPDSHSGRLLIRRSKTDQTGKGSVRYVSDGVMEVLGAMHTMKQGRRSSDLIIGLSPGQICRRIKSVCIQAGLSGHYSGHSPRIGMAIDLARAGVSLPALMEAGRWKSASMPAYYVRAVEAGSGAVAQWHEQSNLWRIAMKERINNMANAEYVILDQSNCASGRLSLSSDLMALGACVATIVYTHGRMQ